VIPIEDSEPFWKRAFLMPLLPELWARAADWRPARLVLPLLTLVAVLGGALAVYRTRDVRQQLWEAADSYDTSYPAVVMDKDGIHLEGEGIIRVDTNRQTLLVDPEETVPLSEIKTPEYVVVRRHEILQRRQFQDQRIRVEDVHRALGDRRLDGASVRSFAARWGRLVQLGMAALTLVVLLGMEAVGGAFSAAVAGGLVYGLRGRGLGLTYEQCFKVALAAYSLAIVVGLVLTFLGKSVGACFGVLVWPVVVTGLALWALAGRARQAP
jgi:uncharacterized protein DUF1189